MRRDPCEPGPMDRPGPRRESVILVAAIVLGAVLGSILGVTLRAMR